MNARTACTPGLAAMMCLALSACGTADPARADDAAPKIADAVTFVAKPGLSPTAEALPRLVGDAPQIATINADLDKIDALDASNLADCDGGEWNRSILKPMTGPGYVTFWIAQDWYCGGAYPATSQTAVTYALATGRRIDWADAIPGLNLVYDSLEGLPDGYVVNVHSATLARWYGPKMLATPDPEWVEQCASAFEPGMLVDQGFRMWADAETGGVSVAPDFPHVSQACAETATMTAADLRGFNADPKLIEAIETAHAAPNPGDAEQAEPGL
ncbi:hypothetical protein [Brevundimonas subvibrioides]|uniref:hypothetical protein n=1 Tax=Brevundimonas subvibrioides TaxID=74313 RepID=UPI0022B52303|nr:hypothetical protein [Brevundimonas subvibrioides]